MTEDEQLPFQIGAYVAESFLGAGGMGIVYRGRAPDGRTVAIKVLRDVTEATATSRFLHESALRIHHPNVVCVIDAGSADHRLFMIQEYLEGESLEERLLRGTLPWREAVGVGIQVCRGLEEVHSRGIIHRDLKPGNIFLTHDGTVKLLDFGIARSMTRETRMTVEGMVIGTPSYLAPEQARGELEMDERADLWALGVMLYEAMSGICPFERQTVAGCLVAVLFEVPDPLSKHVPSVPEELSQIVDECLQKDRDRRWRTATAVLRALEGAAGTPSTVPEPPQSARVAEPSRDTASAVLSRPSIPAGERRIVALLLAEDVRDGRAIATAVEEHGGVFSTLIGGRAVGLFGAERWDGDEAARAAAAALRCRWAAGRVAVASGRAESAENWISGVALERAELGCAAHLDGVAVDTETKGLLSARFRFRARPGGLFELVAERRGTEPPAAHGDGTFGREIELAQIQLAVQLVLEQRRTAVVLVSGPPGAGKTQLARAARAMVSTAGDGSMLIAAGRPLQRDVAFSLLGSALVRRANALELDTGGPRIGPEAPPEERRQAVFALAREAIHDEGSARECGIFLGELLGIAMPESPTLQAARTDPQLMSDRLRLALHDFVDGLLARGPLAFLFEDLHFADDASIAYLDELLRTPDRPLLLMCTMRPSLDERHPALFTRHRTHVVHLPLRGLSRAAVRELAEAVADAPLSGELVDALFARTEGNPLFVSQIVATLRDAGELERSHATLPLPLSVEAAVQSRLDHLPPEEKDACRCAAVLRRPFNAAELAALGVADAPRVLASLARREIFATLSAPRTDTYLFRSPVVLDVSYAMLDAPRRASLHSRAAVYLARSSTENPQSSRSGLAAEEIARHFELGDRAGEAAGWYATAALEAAARADSATVLRASTRALEGALEAQMRFDLHMARADALRFAGRRSEQEAELTRALSLADSDHQRARVLVEHTAWLARMGRSQEALEAADEAVATADMTGDRQLSALAHGRRAEVLIGLGQHAEAATALDTAEQAIEGGPPHIAGMVAGWRGRLAGERGDVGEARIANETAASLLRGAGDLRRAAVAEINLADAYNRVGDYETALDALSRALDAVRRVGHRPGEAYALLNVGYARAQLCDRPGALAALDAAQALAEEQGDTRLLLFTSIYRALALLPADPEEARIEALAATGRAAQTGASALQAIALTLAARAALDCDAVVEALELSTLAIALRDELGGLEENEADLFLTHARALRSNGRPHDARQVIARGTARLLDLAGRIADPVWRERYLTGLPEHRALIRMNDDDEDDMTLPG